MANISPEIGVFNMGDAFPMLTDVPNGSIYDGAFQSAGRDGQMIAGAGNGDIPTSICPGDSKSSFVVS